MKTIITTVGTSIFTNLTKKEGKHDEIKSRFGDLKDIRFSEYGDYSDSIEDKGARKGLRSLVQEAVKTDPKASAEIESILKIAKDEKVIIHLLATDTVLSVLAADIIKDWFDDKQKINFNASYEDDVIKDLLVTDKQTFEKGLTNLFTKIDAIVPEKKGKKDWSDIVFNITGGYKAIIPHLTILAQVYRCPICYIFSEGENNLEPDLIKIPALPINFDWLVAEIYGQYLSSDFVLNKLLEHNPDDFEVLKKYGLVKNEGDSKSRDTFGKLMWQYLSSKMPENPQVTGLFAEYKVYEFFNENRGEYTDLPKRGITIFWDGKDSQKVSCIKEAKLNQKKAEIDVLLQGDTTFAFIEVKSVLKIEELLKDKNGKLDIANKIESLQSLIKDKKLKEFILVIHKIAGIPFIESEHLANLQVIKQQCSKYSINASFHWIDFEVKRDSISLEFTNFLNNPIVKSDFDKNKININV